MSEPKNKTLLANRRWLKSVLPEWQENAWITSESAKALHEHYKLQEVEQESASTFLIAVYSIGALVLGGGVISFVAANWEYLGAIPKILLLIFSLLLTHGVGYYLWKIDGRWEKLGQAFIVLGTVIYAANLGLMAQIFHIRGNWYNIFGGTALGALAFGLGMRSLPNAIIALVCTFVWSIGYTLDHGSMSMYLPLVMLLGFAALSVWMNSVVLFSLTLLAFSWSIWAVNAEALTNVPFILSLGFATGLTALGAGATVHHWFDRVNFRAASVVVVVLGLGWVLYLLSFLDVSREFMRVSDRLGIDQHPSYLWVWFYAILGLGLLLWDAIQQRQNAESERFKPMVQLGWGLAAACLVMMGVVLGRDGEVAALLANLFSFVLAGFLLWMGIHWQSRAPFWGGILFAMLLIVSRFFEYTEDLMVKAVVFILCGAAMLYLTWQFEKSYKRKQTEQV